MFRTTLTIGFVGAICFAVYFLLSGLDNPGLDMHAFRQSQTAISAYWIAHGGPWIDYETPVLGSPWAIPFEFPIYQWLVALLSLSDMSINASGRLISFLFYVGTLLPVWLLSRTYKVNLEGFLIFSILYLLCPLYIYWGRSVMMESAAVFFSALWLSTFARFLVSGKVVPLVLALLSGSLAVLTKTPTFPAFAFAGGVVYLHSAYSWWRDGFLPPHVHRLLTGILLVVAPITIGYIWVIYSDSIKSLNPIGGRFLTSGALKHWNFGSLDQRLSAHLWKTIIPERALPDIFGYGVLPATVAFGATLWERRHFLVALVGICAFLFGILIFTNLHIVHNYYQVANAIFLTAAAAVGIQLLSTQNKRGLAALLLIAIGVGQVAYVHNVFKPMISGDGISADRYAIAIEAATSTDPRQSILVFGTDWSSEVPYYAQRKAFAMPNWAPIELVRDVISQPDKYLKGYPLGAIVNCFPADSKGQAEIVKQMLQTKVALKAHGSCHLYAP